ncbi:MAG: AsnC family transcriptional regulator [Methylococcales bacterium]|nr:AsnC family transcriptional regulator [Methylococcales bacterium]
MLDELNQQLLAQLSDGLPICSRPYDEISKRLSISETEVIERITALQQSGIIKRFGVIVKHAALGYRANAMCVWRIPENQIDDIARYLLTFPFVTLCYQRPMQPEWQYNLYCMIHGKDKETVTAQIGQIRSHSQMQNVEHQVLFSSRCFKQRGAIYR